MTMNEPKLVRMLITVDQATAREIAGLVVEAHGCVADFDAMYGDEAERDRRAVLVTEAADLLRQLADQANEAADKLEA